MIGTCEALAMGTASGMDPVVLSEILKASSGRNCAWRAEPSRLPRDLELLSRHGVPSTRGPVRFQQTATGFRTEPLAMN